MLVIPLNTLNVQLGNGLYFSSQSINLKEIKNSGSWILSNLNLHLGFTEKYEKWLTLGIFSP